ncbi:hypothetical protein ATCC90586_008008 [Pythium insidiosum]|nr:hypothetical protein ATCC90586_008008 [Pythium insidiosum]
MGSPRPSRSRLLRQIRPGVLLPAHVTFVAEAFLQIGCEVLDCSTDSKFLHLAWINTPRKMGCLGEMQNPLIADYNKEIARAYNVVIEEIENASRLRDFSCKESDVARMPH